MQEEASAKSVKKEVGKYY